MNQKITSPLQRALNIWAIIIVIWSLYRVNIFAPVWFDEFIAKPLVFIGIVSFYLKSVAKVKVLDEINFSFRTSVEDIFVVLFIGATFIITALAGNYFKVGELVSPDKLTLIASSGFLFSIVLAFATAISEEFLSVGYILPKLFGEFKNTFITILASAGLFSIMHIPMLVANLKLDGYTILVLLFANLILGMINALITLDRKNIFLAILIHTFYNVSVLLFI